MHTLRFRLRRDTPEATVICIESPATGQMGPALPYPASTAWRRRQVDAVADWLGRVRGDDASTAPELRDEARNEPLLRDVLDG